MGAPFYIKDCDLMGLATGEAASSLLQFKEIIARIPLSSLYHHFWGARLRPTFIHPDYHNDFSYWAHFALHDNILSERLGIIDPKEYPDLERLRVVLIDVIDTRLDEIDFILWSKQETKFYFTRSITVVFDTSFVVNVPAELKSIIPQLSTSSIFYHFIDARRRTKTGMDDFISWISEYGGHEDLIDQIKTIDPYFLPLSEIKMKLAEIINRYFK